MSKPNTNQASEDELKKRIGNLHAYNFDGDDVTVKVMVDEDVLESIAEFVEAIIHTEKLKLLDEVIHQSTVNLKSAKAVACWAELRKEQLEAEL